MFVSKRFVLFTIFALVCLLSFSQALFPCGCEIEYGDGVCTTRNELFLTECFVNCSNQTIACTGPCPCYKDPSEIPPPKPCILENGACEKHIDCCGECEGGLRQICRGGVCKCRDLKLRNIPVYTRTPDNIDACTVRCPNTFGANVCDGYNQTLRNDCWANCTARPIAHEGRCSANIPVDRPDDLCQAEGAYCLESTTRTECCKCPNGAYGRCTRRRCRCPLIPLTPSSPADECNCSGDEYTVCGVDGKNYPTKCTAICGGHSIQCLRACPCGDGTPAGSPFDIPADTSGDDP